MLQFSGSTFDIIADVCLIMSIVFAVLIISQVILLVILRSKLKKKAQKDSQKLMSFAGLFLLAGGMPVLWVVLCPILFIVYVALLVYNTSLFLGLIAPKKAAAPKEEEKPAEAPVLFEAEPAMTEEQEQELVASLVREEISTEEAHEALTDEIATHFVEIEDSHSDKKYSNKSIINIDTLALHFEQGDTVTLEVLKEKGLIPAKTDFVKVLAHGSLNKSLIVEAQDYSVDAIKMIILTGGRVIKKI